MTRLRPAPVSSKLFTGRCVPELALAVMIALFVGFWKNVENARLFKVVAISFVEYPVLLVVQTFSGRLLG